MLKFLHRIGLPVDASSHGRIIDTLLVNLHWFMISLFLFWLLFFIYTLIRFRAGRRGTDGQVHPRHHIPTPIAVGIIVIEVLLLVSTHIPIWVSGGLPKLSEEDDVTELHVIAQQYVWNIHYPGPDGKYGRRSIELIDPEVNPIGLDTDDESAKDDIWMVNDLRVPVGKPVFIRLSSLDVIHSFFLPNMRIKQDVIPGMETAVRFIPTRETGDEKWQIACAQLCGVGHYRMAGRFAVVSDKEFYAWYKERLDEMTAAAEDDW